MQILLRLTSKSEKKFFEILSRNSHVALRDICRNIARVQVYRFLKRLEYFDIIKRTYDTSKITSLPVVNIEVKKMIEIKDIYGEKWAVIG
jgi:predicted transcriptional regulator